MSVTIITGERGAGKTGYLSGYVAAAKARGRSVGGVLAPAVFQGGQRSGYDLVDLRTGARWPLARVVRPGSGTALVGVYHFDDTALREGNWSILTALAEGADIIAIDEVGPLEFRGDGWAGALQSALEQCGRRQELVVVVRATLVEELSARFPSPRWAEARRIAPPWPPLADADA